MRELLTQLNIPVARNKFNFPQVPPYIVYISASPDNTGADDIVYFSQDAYLVEMYTDKKDVELENRIENLFNTNEIFWEKDGDIYIPDEDLYMTRYYI